MSEYTNIIRPAIFDTHETQYEYTLLYDGHKKPWININRHFQYFSQRAKCASYE